MVTETDAIGDERTMVVHPANAVAANFAVVGGGGFVCGLGTGGS